MKIVDVLPLSRGVFREKLSYFSGKDLESGSLVSVPIRSSSVQAIVIEVREASSLKTELRKADFELKKLGEVRSRKLLLSETISAAKETADYFATTTGAVLEFLVPKSILSSPPFPDYPKKIKKNEKNGNEGLALEKQGFGAPNEERQSRYKSLVRESFARNASVLMLCPTIYEANSLFEYLSKGIEEYVFLLHGKLSAKELRLRWSEASEKIHPILLVGTALALSVPRSDYGTIIIEHESSRFYRTQARPFLDVRIFAEFLSMSLRTKFILGDFFLRAETFGRSQSGFEISQGKIPLPSVRKLILLGKADLEEKQGEGETKKIFTALGEEAVEMMRRAIRDEGRIFILAGRKGLAPTITCGDCQNVVLCKECHAPIILVGAKERDGRKGKNYFLCRICGTRRSAEESCGSCGSWNLLGLGIGTEGIEKEAEALFPEAKIFRLDGETSESSKKNEEFIRAFEKKKGAILIGTEMALSLLSQKVHTGIIASLDSVLALPDFRAQEKVFSLALRVGFLSEHAFLIQTRIEGGGPFPHIIRGNPNSFFEEELQMRKIFEFPPFGRFIRVTRNGDRERVRQEMQTFANSISSYEPILFSSGGESGKSSAHSIIHLRGEKTFDQNLLKILSSLSPKFQVEVDPEGLFSLPKSENFL
ncbi:MAG: hypothetical protein AAB545_01135 [Patescibacteria group bacterium]